MHTQRLCTFCVSLECRHLYYNENPGFSALIKRINLDGSDIALEEDPIASLISFDGISGMAIDHHNNILYWAMNSTDSSTISYLNINDWTRAHQLRANLVSILHMHIPYSGKLSREKTFANFMDLGPFMKVFSTKKGCGRGGFYHACACYTARSSIMGVSSTISSLWQIHESFLREILYFIDS